MSECRDRKRAMTCPRWKSEKAAIKRMYTHVGKGYLARRKRYHRWNCVECGSGWTPPVRLPRQPDDAPPR